MDAKEELELIDRQIIERQAIVRQITATQELVLDQIVALMKRRWFLEDQGIQPNPLEGEP